ncbi:MAG TPA: hypothetical protein VIK97_12715 [Casimicrobiaceae bacterium]
MDSGAGVGEGRGQQDGAHRGRLATEYDTGAPAGNLARAPLLCQALRLRSSPGSVAGGARNGCAVVAMLLLGGCDAATHVVNRYNPFVSFEGRCERLPPSRTTVIAREVTVGENNALSQRALSALHQEIPETVRTYGLTQATFRQESQLEINGLTDARGGRACFRPQVQVELTMRPMTIYIATEATGDQCRDAVHDHELKHVAVYRQRLAEAAAELKHDLPELYGQAVFVVGDQAASESEMRGRLGEFMHDFMADNMETLKARQAAVDSPEEYARVRNACADLPSP